MTEEDFEALKLLLLGPDKPPEPVLEIDEKTGLVSFVYPHDREKSNTGSNLVKCSFDRCSYTLWEWDFT